MLATDDKYGWTVLSYCLCIFFILAFAFYGLIWAKFKLAGEMVKVGPCAPLHAMGTRLTSIQAQVQAGTAEMFTTGKGTQGMWRIGWSFFASAMGGWVITAPANFAVWGGWIAMMMYAIATGIPILIIAFLGEHIVTNYPQCCSLGDYVAWRFGPTLKLYVTGITLFNMAIFLLAEFTTIGALFQNFVGDINYPIIIIVGCATSAYTAYGGLIVSIVTDQAQTVVTLLIVTIVWIYVAIEFRAPLEPNFGGYQDLLGPQFYGYSAIFSLPASLVAATIFSEAVWQRVWASQDKRALRGGAIIGATSVVVVVFLFGLCGFLACWGGLIDLDTADPNLYLFQVFKRGPGQGMATVDSWIAELVLILAIIMNESAIDTLQNGITSTVSSQFFRGHSVNVCRVISFLICVPLVVIATFNYQILSMFLISNMLCCCCSFPVVLGLIEHPIFKKMHTETCAIFSCTMSIITVCVYGIIERNHVTGGAMSTDAAVTYAWLGNGYSYDYFLVAVFFPLAWMIFYIVIAQTLKACGIDGISVSTVCLAIPPMKILFGHWEQDLSAINVDGKLGLAEDPVEMDASNFAPPQTFPPKVDAQMRGTSPGAMYPAMVPPGVVPASQPYPQFAAPQPRIVHGAMPVNVMPVNVHVGAIYQQQTPQMMNVPMSNPLSFMGSVPSAQQPSSYVPMGGSTPPVAFRAQ